MTSLKAAPSFHRTEQDLPFLLALIGLRSAAALAHLSVTLFAWRTHSGVPHRAHNAHT
jgi:hypothetical protein